MRRSCTFCRSRKIKCTGQSKCDACRERNIDCVYGVERIKGRPRGSTTKGSGRSSGQHLQLNKVNVDMSDLHTAASPVYGDASNSDSSCPSPPHKLGRQSRPLDSDMALATSSIAYELEAIFRQFFTDEIVTSPLQPYQRALSEFRSSQIDIQRHASSGPTSGASCPAFQQLLHAQ